MSWRDHESHGRGRECLLEKLGGSHGAIANGSRPNFGRQPMGEGVPRLRPYQVADLKKIYEAFKRNGRVCYQAPTGSGKTRLATEFLSRQSDDRILILAHRDEILQQIDGALKTLGIRHGIIAPDYPETKDRVQVASVMTVVRRLDRIKPPTLIWIDEAHHAAAETWRRILAAWPDADVLGTTATPRRLDGKPLDDIFDELVIGPSIARLIDDEWLAPCTVFVPARGPDLSKVQIRAGDYAIDQLSTAMSNSIIVGSAVREYERICSGGPSIAFCVDTAHSKLVAEAFGRHGYRAQHVDGETPRGERRNLIAALADGSIDVLCNCGLISEGLDVPGVEVVIGLRPTRSLALYLQMVGRALRPGKPMAFLLDHAGNTYRHGLPTARRRWTLHGRQTDDNAGDGLRRCRACGAVNERDAEVCAYCGAELPHRERQRRTIVTGPKLAEAVEVPINDTDLAHMTYRDCLAWAADADGNFIPERLQRIASARRYKPGWVYYTRKHWSKRSKKPLLHPENDTAPPRRAPVRVFEAAP
jgi:DNA repair protein RadD